MIDGPVRMSANNMEVLLAAAVSGSGVAYGPSFVFDVGLANGDLVKLLPDYRTQDLAIYALYPTNRYVPLKLRAFVDHLAARLGNDVAQDQSA